MPPEIRGNHHLTFCVGTAQEDYDFHTGTLGLRSIKKTALYDGEVPIYHLYYGNAEGDGGTILTSFPMRQQGIRGRLGTNQISGPTASSRPDSSPSRSSSTGPSGCTFTIRAACPTAWSPTVTGTRRARSSGAG
jgi:catechol 2,3-dioxygenase-like lactoylglutathione lyase family enzyme